MGAGDGIALSGTGSTLKLVGSGNTVTVAGSGNNFIAVVRREQHDQRRGLDRGEHDHPERRKQPDLGRCG